jgi:hypothetical protein
MCLPTSVYIGMVKYRDPKTEPLQCPYGSPFPNLFEWIMNKDRDYKYENELRCVATYDNTGNNLFETENGGKVVYAPSIDLSQLILSVHLDKNADNNHKEKVRALLKEENLDHLFYKNDKVSYLTSSHIDKVFHD